MERVDGILVIVIMWREMEDNNLKMSPKTVEIDCSQHQVT